MEDPQPARRAPSREKIDQPHRHLGAGQDLFPQWAPVFAGVTSGWSACFPGTWQAVFIGFMSGFPLLRSPSRSHGRQQLFPLRSLLPAYFSSTSAGAIVGRRSELTRKMRGSFTPSVFQPRWTSVPENGPAPLMFPIRRYSSAAYPTGMVTDDPSFSSRTDRILKCSWRAALHPSCTTRAAAPTWASPWVV